MTSLPQNGHQDKPSRVAIYARVSTEEQAEDKTFDSQLEFLRKYVGLYGLDSAGEYVDAGWSGTIPLGDRPNGRRLIDDARAGHIQQVLVYRLDRLGRSLRGLLDAHAMLDAVGVTIRSATEPFDTESPFGRFMFQFL